MNKKDILSRLSISVGTQVVSLLCNFCISFLVPKFIPELQYSYWQSFVLYIGYAGIFHFGLLDGIMLRYSKYDYIDLDKSIIRSQFLYLVSSCGIISIFILFISLFIKDQKMKIICCLLAIGINTKNIVSFESYICQATNRIKGYARVILTQRVVSATLVVLTLVNKGQWFVFFCIADLLGDLSVIIYSFVKNKEIHFGTTPSLSETFAEVKKNIGAGIKLMISNLSSIMLTGGVKIVIQQFWGLVVFGKVSFAFNITSMLLSFVNAVSIVVFPTLRRMNQEELPILYQKVRRMISVFLCCALLTYYPCCFFIRQIIPQYSISMNYVGVIFPILIFSSLQNLLINNYLKAYRRESVMLMVNCFTAVVAVSLFLFFSFVFSNLNAVLYVLVLSIALNVFISETILTKVIDCNTSFYYSSEIIITILFWISNYFFSNIVSCCLVGFACSIYCLLTLKRIRKK